MDIIICIKRINRYIKEEFVNRFRNGKVKFGSTDEFLLELKKEFGRVNEELVEVAELRRIEQKEKIMEEFIQEFQRAARSSKYKRKVLVKKFKMEINRVIRKKLIEIEKPPKSIEQWYEHATNLDRYQRESKKEEERLREKKRREIRNRYRKK